MELLPIKKQKNGCGICGGKQVKIRGRFPMHPKRLVCPTCTYERLELINEISSQNYLKAGEAQ